MKIAVIETKMSSVNWSTYIEGDFDRYALCSNPAIKKVLKGDVDIEIDIDQYDWLILVGAEPFKLYTKKTSVTEFNGQVIDKKFLGLINPAMIKFKPEAKDQFEKAIDSINKYIKGDKKQRALPDEQCYGIQDKETAMKYLQEAYEHENNYIALDSET